MDISAEFMSAAINAFEANKRLADRAVEQVPDDKLHVALDENTNSIAVIMKHIAGNLNSRWTDFLTTDGEKPWRNRDDEFVDSFANRAELLAFWERGWSTLLQSLQSLTPDDLKKTGRSAANPIRCRWPSSARWAIPATTSARSFKSPESTAGNAGAL
jgi:hypothetical protein